MDALLSPAYAPSAGADHPGRRAIARDAAGRRRAGLSRPGTRRPPGRRGEVSGAAALRHVLCLRRGPLGQRLLGDAERRLVGERRSFPALGFCPSSRGSQSWAVPGHPSRVAPGKRPRLTPNPALAIRQRRSRHALRHAGRRRAAAGHAAGACSTIASSAWTCRRRSRRRASSPTASPTASSRITYHPGRLDLEQGMGRPVRRGAPGRDGPPGGVAARPVAQDGRRLRHLGRSQGREALRRGAIRAAPAARWVGEADGSAL